MLKKFLVFSDLHINPRKTNPILTEITRSIMANKPDYIVCTGDLGDFRSKNKLVKDRGNYSTEEELTAVFDVLDKHIFMPVKFLQDKQRKSKHKIYRPKLVFCLGNHDEPVSSALVPVLSGLGATVVPYRHQITLEGITFSHTFDNGISGYPCTTTAQILTSTLSRTVSGHSHVRSITEQRDSSGYKVFAIKMPCANTDRPEWAKMTSLKWDRGYLYLTVDTESDWYQYTFKEFRDGKRI